MAMRTAKRIFIFVKIAAEIGKDEFYILTKAELILIIYHNYQSFLNKHFPVLYQ